MTTHSVLAYVLGSTGVLVLAIDLIGCRVRHVTWWDGKRRAGPR
jgi:hypothetical protein